MENLNLFEQSLAQSPSATPSHDKTTFVREVSVTYRGARRATTMIRKAQDIADFIRKILPDNSREHFVALYLDAAHKVIAFYVVSTGTIRHTLVHPREVFQSAIHVGAAAIAVGHNHPSGSTRPSPEDTVVTKTLDAAGELLGVRLLDHVIVTEDSFFSYTENGAFRKRAAGTHR